MGDWQGTREREKGRLRACCLFDEDIDGNNNNNDDDDDGDDHYKVCVGSWSVNEHRVPLEALPPYCIFSRRLALNDFPGKIECHYQ